MRNSFKSLLAMVVVIMTLGFSACFDIIEEYEFNADGSGKATLLVDVGKFMSFMEGMGSMMDSASTEEGESASNSMEEMFTDTKAIDALKQVPGISNVKNLNNREEKIVGYSFEFANIEALNAAMIVRGQDVGLNQALGISAPVEADTDTEYFTLKGKKFHRTLTMAMDESEDEDDESKQAAEMVKMMFKDAKYTVRYTFANKVKKVKGNESALVGADGKTVTIENSLGDLLEGKSTMSCDIKLK